MLKIYLNIITQVSSAMDFNLQGIENRRSDLHHRIARLIMLCFMILQAGFITVEH